MSQIEVPDWVVSNVLDELFPGNSGYVIPNYRDPMKSALTAALGAWVVPVPQFGDASSESEWFDGVLTSIDPDDTFYKTRTLYDLRQEKLE